MSFLILRFECQGNFVRTNRENEALMRAYKKDVTNEINGKVLEEWKESMEGKSNLGRYRASKRVRGTIEHIHDDSRGSTLLAEASAVFLMTRKFRPSFEEIRPRCESCARDETLEHVIPNCHETTNSGEKTRKKTWVA